MLLSAFGGSLMGKPQSLVIVVMYEVIQLCVDGICVWFMGGVLRVCPSWCLATIDGDSCMLLATVVS